MKLETKQNEKGRSSPQISGVMVLHHNMVSSQMVSPGAGPPLATPLRIIIIDSLLKLRALDYSRKPIFKPEVLATKLVNKRLLISFKKHKDLKLCIA